MISFHFLHLSAVISLLMANSKFETMLAICRPDRQLWTWLVPSPTRIVMFVAFFFVILWSLKRRSSLHFRLGRQPLTLSVSAESCWATGKTTLFGRQPDRDWLEAARFQSELRVLCVCNPKHVGLSALPTFISRSFLNYKTPFAFVVAVNTKGPVTIRGCHAQPWNTISTSEQPIQYSSFNIIGRVMSCDGNYCNSSSVLAPKWMMVMAIGLLAFVFSSKGTQSL